MKSVHNRCVSGLELYSMGMQGMFKSATLYINMDAKILSNKQFKRFCRLKKQFFNPKSAKGFNEHTYNQPIQTALPLPLTAQWPQESSHD